MFLLRAFVEDGKIIKPKERNRKEWKGRKAKCYCTVITQGYTLGVADELKDAPQYMDYAKRALRTAQVVYEDGDWVAAVNRAYYAIFYAANAMLELEGLERSKHFGVISLFRQKYVKTGLIEIEYSDIYGQAIDTRNEGDYERSSFPSQAEAKKMIEGAQQFVARIEKFLGD